MSNSLPRYRSASPLILRHANGTTEGAHPTLKHGSNQYAPKVDGDFSPSTLSNAEAARLADVEPACNSLRAELSGSDTAAAAGITVVAYAPVLELCRRLVAAGYDPAARLEAYRDRTLCLTVRSIGEAAGLEINSKGTGLARRRPVRAASPIRLNGVVARIMGADLPAREVSGARSSQKRIAR
jgi:hypothetical protein